jgi:hypothetical protein
MQKYVAGILSQDNSPGLTLIGQAAVNGNRKSTSCQQTHDPVALGQLVGAPAGSVNLLPKKDHTG